MTREWSTPTAWTDAKAISTARLTLISTLLSWLYKTLSADEGSTLTISSGEITVTGNEVFYKVSGEGAAADDLVTINGGTEDDIIILAYDGEAITLKETGNIVAGDYGDVILGAAGHLAGFRYDGTNWTVIFCTVVELEKDTTPALGGDLDAKDKEINNIKVVDFQDEHNASASTTIDWREGQNQYYNIDSNDTLAFTDPDGPCHVQLRVIQDATGGRTITWPTTGKAVKWPRKIAPTLSDGANEEDIFTFWYNGSYYYGSYGIDFGIPS